MVCAEAKQKGCHRGRGRRHRADGLKISGRLLSVLCFPCRGGASAWCWRPLSLHSSREDRGSDRSSKPDPPLGSNCCGPLPSGRRPFFFPICSRSPWRPRQKPLIAGIARNGAALHVFCVVSHVTPQRQHARRPTFPPGVIFSRSRLCQSAPYECRPTRSPV